ncbi:MAG: M23 family metallopeptidase [Actinomycetota bacterium]
MKQVWRDRRHFDHLIEMSRPDPDPDRPQVADTAERCTDPARRRLILGAAGGTLLGAFGMARLGEVMADEQPVLETLTNAGSALQPATRLGSASGPQADDDVDTTAIDRAPDELLDVPDGMIMFPLLAASDCFVLDNFGDGRGCCRLHVGLDIMGSENQPVFAVTDGVLAEKYTNTGTAGWGWKIEDDDNNVVTKYFHLAKDLRGLEIGDTVRRGDVIGYVGDSGTTVGNFHLHFEYRPNDVPIDPLPLLNVPDNACGVSNPLRG